ncbi:MAG: DMT family transporter [Promethearchaeota archaeon]
MSDVIGGILAGFVYSISYAFATVGYQSQIEESNSFVANCIKTWAAAPLMIGAMLVVGSTSLFSVPCPAALSFILSMLAGVIVADTFYLAGQRRVGVTYALPISMTYPIFTYIIALVVNWESFMVSRLLGVAIAVLGVSVLSWEQGSMSETDLGLGFVDKTGLLFAVITSFLFALSALFIQAGVYEVDPVIGASIRIISGSVVMAPLGLLAKAKGVLIPSRRSATIIAVSGFFGMGVATLFWVTAIKHVGAVTTSVLGTTSVLFGVPVSVFVLGERVSRTTVLSIAATVFGVILVVLGT